MKSPTELKLTKQLLKNYIFYKTLNETKTLKINDICSLYSLESSHLVTYAINMINGKSFQLNSYANECKNSRAKL